MRSFTITFYETFESSLVNRGQFLFKEKITEIKNNNTFDRLLDY